LNCAASIEDTLLQSYILESDKSHDLGALASRHCGLATISYDSITGKGASRISFAQVALSSRPTNMRRRMPT
jgi:DNA polymerase-1